MPLNLNPLYEQDVPFMSKAASPKDGKRNTTRSKIVPFALLRSR